MIASSTSVPISPAWPVVMGCGPTLDPIGEVSDPLEANLVLLRDGNRRALLVSLDSLYVGPTLRSELEAALTDHLSPEQIFIGASHTHYAPMLDSTKPRLGTVDDQHFRRLVELVVQAAISLVKKPGEATSLRSARFVTSAPMNRRLRRRLGGAERRLRLNTVVMGPNPKATGDQFGHALRFDDPSGRPVAVVWQLPCHPTSMPSGTGHSAHFPGYVRAALRRRYGRGVPVLFFQGFSGDLRPPSVVVPRGLKARARAILLGRWFVDFEPPAYEAWARSICTEVESALESAMRAESDPGLDCKRTSRPLRDLVSGDGVDARAVTAQRVTIGNVDLVGFSAEVVSGYARRLVASDSSRLCVPVGCIDDAFGYAPTSEMIAAGGYEGSGFLPHFDLESLNEGFQDSVIGCLASVRP